MVAEAMVFDISNEPELARLAEEVRATGTPRLLRRDHEDVAMLVPVKPKRARDRSHQPSAADIVAFRAAAGGWKGNVDGEAFKRDNRASRDISFKS